MQYEDKWWAQVLDSMSPDNPRWEGWHGALPSKDALDMADKVLSELYLPDRGGYVKVFPSISDEDGTIGAGVEWELELHDCPYFVSVVISPDLTYVVRALNLDRVASTEFSTETDSFAEAMRLLHSLLDGVRSGGPGGRNWHAGTSLPVIFSAPPLQITE